MAQTNIGATTTTSLDTTITDYSVDTKQTEGVGEQEETYYDYPNFTKYHGYYSTIPELKKAIDALVLYTVGQGYEADARTKIILEHITGIGKDTFDGIINNLFVVELFNGDAFAEIIRDEESGLLLNLKPLDPSSMRAVFGRNGILIRYEQRSKSGSMNVKKFKPNQILHLINDRTADEMHGKSVVEACEWVILARNEAMSDKRRVHHRSTIRVIEVDTDNTSQLSTLKTQYADAINNGEVLIVPKGNFGFPEAPINYIDTQEWIRYLENFFYQAVGVPRVIANTENFTEASSKTGIFTFHPIYTKQQVKLQSELWNQLNLLIKFNTAPTLTDNMQSDEAKNTGQVGFQPNDTQMGVGK